MPITRDDVSFPSGGLRCAAWFYRPACEPPFPCVILAHGLGGIRAHRLDAYARRFAEAGLAALAFDYRHFGDSEGSPRQLVSIARQLEDYEAALAWCRQREEIDPARLALWGTSFSGGHVLQLAGRHRELAAIVAQCPFTDGVGDGLKLRSAWQSFRLTLAGVYDQLRGWLGLSPFYVPVVGSPGSLAALNKPGALEGYLAAANANPADPPQLQITARSLLRIPFYRPILQTGNRSCPLLICICEADTEVIPESACRAAKRAPNGYVIHYPVNHFEIYLEANFERAVQDQINFFQRSLF